MIRFKNFKIITNPIFVGFVKKLWPNKLTQVHEQYFNNENENDNHYDALRRKREKIENFDLNDEKNAALAKETNKKINNYEKNKISMSKHIDNYGSDGRKAIHFYTDAGSSTLLAQKHLAKGAGLLAKSKKKDKESFLNRQDSNTEAFKKRDHCDKHLSRLIQMHTSRHDMHVFSGLTFSPEHKNKKEYTLPTYTSTSIAKGIARGFSSPVPYSNHIYDHTGKKISLGDHVKHLKNIKKLGEKINDLYNSLASSGKHINDILDHPELEKIEKARIDSRKKAGEKYSHMLRIHIPKDSHGVYLENHTTNLNEEEILLHKNAKLRIHPEPIVNHNNYTVEWHAKLIHDGIKPTRHMYEKD